MVVLMNGVVSGMTAEVYDGMAAVLMPKMRLAKGFIAHAAGPASDGTWRVTELWESEEDSERWFEENVRPNLPAGIQPDRKFQKVHNLLKA